MKYLVFNWDMLDEQINGSSNDLSNEEFERLANKYGAVYNSADEFQRAFNEEEVSTHTHQLRIVEY